MIKLYLQHLEQANQTSEGTEIFIRALVGLNWDAATRAFDQFLSGLTAIAKPCSSGIGFILLFGNGEALHPTLRERQSRISFILTAIPGELLKIEAWSSASN